MQRLHAPVSHCERNSVTVCYYCFNQASSWTHLLCTQRWTGSLIWGVSELKYVEGAAREVVRLRRIGREIITDINSLSSAAKFWVLRLCNCRSAKTSDTSKVGGSSGRSAALLNYPSAVCPFWVILKGQLYNLRKGTGHDWNLLLRFAFEIVAFQKISSYKKEGSAGTADFQ